MGKRSSASKKKGCLSTFLLIIAAICFLPVIVGFGWLAGIVWLIFFRRKLKENPNKQKKYTIGIAIASALSLLFFIYAMVTAPPSPTSVVLSSSIEGQILEINTDYVINVQYEPEDASLSTVSFDIDNPDLANVSVNEDNPSLLILHTEKEGTITITVRKSGIESNTLSFEIIDSTKINQEQTSEAENLQFKEKQPIIENDTQHNTETTNSVESEPYDEDPLGFSVIFSKTYRNDTTGNWRLSRISENIKIEEHALDYYRTYFESDNEVHIIINFALNTTTRITVMGNLLDVSIMEYVDKEEHDASLACSGMLLNEYHVNINTGKIEEIKKQEADIASSQSVETSEQPVSIDNEAAVTMPSEPAAETYTLPSGAPLGDTPSSSSSGNNFNTYDNSEQQQTADTYVLNTSRHKIHYPSCSSVAKIAPQNYATSNLSISELEAQGYTTCGNCFR